MVKWVAAGRIIKTTTAATPRITRSDSKSYLLKQRYNLYIIVGLQLYDFWSPYYVRKIKGHICILRLTR